MTPDPEALQSRWRRLSENLAAAHAADAASGTAMVDAVARTLHEVYDLWEAHKLIAGKSNAELDALVHNDDAGETAAALVHARGATTHSLIQFGDYLGYGQSPYGVGPYGRAAWYWQSYTDPRTSFAKRDAYYASRLQAHWVPQTLESGVTWLRLRPELQPPT